MTRKQIAPWLRNIITNKERFHEIIDSFRAVSSTGGKSGEEDRLGKIWFCRTKITLLKIEEILSALIKPKGAKK